MKKVLFVVVLILLFSGGGYYFWQRSQVTTPPAESPVVAETTPTPVDLATWEDPNGFRFQYPKNLKMNVHDEDTQNYAHIEFTNSDHAGSVIVWGKDTKSTDAAVWVIGEKSLKDPVVLDTTMGGISGKKVIVEAPKKQIVSAIVDAGVVFYVEGNLDDSEYWTDVHTTITSTFEFTYNKPAADQAAETGEEVYVDEEEVIE